MSDIRESLGNLTSLPSVWTIWAVIVIGAWFFGGLWWLILLGITGSLGGLALTVHSLLLSGPERDPAIEALRKRYASGEIGQDEFESTLRRLAET